MPYHSHKKQNRQRWALYASSLPHAGHVGLLSSSRKMVRGYLGGRGKRMVKRTVCLQGGIKLSSPGKKNQQGVCLLLFYCREGSWRKVDTVDHFQRKSLCLHYFISKLGMPPAYWHSPLQSLTVAPRCAFSKCFLTLALCIPSDGCFFT